MPMRERDLQYLVCPQCQENLDMEILETGKDGETIKTATLTCQNCKKEYPVINGIPRFVPLENYASSFGLEWTIHAKTQYDSYSGLTLSEKRFFEETRWPRSLPGEVVLEVGSGSGRFTEQALKTGATVVSMDYSYAVDANYASNGRSKNALIVQGDVCQMPFRMGVFDKLFCFGMLQHTPVPKAALKALPAMLKPGGELVIDIYKKTIFSTILHTKYLARFFTRNMNPDGLYRLTQKWVDLMWPLHTLVRRIPRIGHSINWRLLVADYSTWGVDGDLLKEWAYLDTFDMLGPRYDTPQTLSTVRKWFGETGLIDVEVNYGHNGIEGRGKRPLCAE
jgi:2-polyprenyl-3-methyl-5-hydroxy-6-metoxy-1,4-benzoquinol methylase/uncharacterized protein YbaR (Trm112 family)